MSRKRESCTSCGQKLPLEHTHGLCVGTVTTLTKFYKVAGLRPMRLADLDLSRNQADNFQKLKHWGLISPHVTEANSRKRGWWRVMELGQDFVCGKAKLSQQVVTFMDKQVRFKGRDVVISDVVEGYMYRGDYAEAAQRPD